jgi:Glu-tRNA(Gln) amidotransferase subunit E-like FAD-binding protein
MTDGFHKEVSNMSNLGEAVYEEAVNKGQTEGFAEGLRCAISAFYSARIPLERIYALVKENENYSEVTEEEICSLYQATVQERAEILQTIVSSLCSAKIPLEQIYTVIKRQTDYSEFTEEEILAVYQSVSQANEVN